MREVAYLFRFVRRSRAFAATLGDRAVEREGHKQANHEREKAETFDQSRRDQHGRPQISRRFRLARRTFQGRAGQLRNTTGRREHANSRAKSSRCRNVWISSRAFSILPALASVNAAACAEAQSSRRGAMIVGNTSRST